MWTPKRVVMLSVCFVAAFAVYLGYSYTAIGGIDGLPPLPEAYWPTPWPRQRPSHQAQQAVDAGGHHPHGVRCDDCPELDRTMRPPRAAREEHGLHCRRLRHRGRRPRSASRKLSLATRKDLQDFTFSRGARIARTTRILRDHHPPRHRRLDHLRPPGPPRSARSPRRKDHRGRAERARVDLRNNRSQEGGSDEDLPPAHRKRPRSTTARTPTRSGPTPTSRSTTTAASPSRTLSPARA